MYEGGCQCGHIRYTLDAEPLGLVACHCRECQRQSGSAFGMSLFVPAQAFTLTSGELASFTRTTDSGRTLTCSFCPRCGVRIHHRPEYATGTLNIKPGTLDVPVAMAPQLHVWTRSKHDWLPLPEGVQTHDTQPV